MVEHSPEEGRVASSNLALSTKIKKAPFWGFFDTINSMLKLGKKTEYSLIVKRLSDGKSIINYNPDKYFYAASVYKLFIAAEVLRLIDVGNLTLDQDVLIDRKNIIGDENGIISKSHNPIFDTNQKIKIRLLLDLMISESCNTSANVLMDLVGREGINKNIIEKFGWHGSEITRKFLSREAEDELYKNKKPTMTSAKDIIELLLLINTNSLISQFVSEYIKDLMFKCKDISSKSIYNKKFEKFYHKTGSTVVNLWKEGVLIAVKNIFRKNWTYSVWQHDVGGFSFDGEDYVFAFLSHSKTILKIKLKTQEISNFILNEIKKNP